MPLHDGIVEAERSASARRTARFSAFRRPVTCCHRLSASKLLRGTRLAAARRMNMLLRAAAVSSIAVFLAGGIACNAITGADDIDFTARAAGQSALPTDDAGKKRAGESPLLAVLAGTDGGISTLATYPNGNAHPGTNAMDIGAPGGSAVWHQLDYLDSHIGGGWLYVTQVHESGYCSQWTPGSSYYNGGKILVYAYLYDTAGSYLGSHRAAFQHVEPHAANLDAWWTWNNAAADRPLWPSASVTLGNQKEGGLYLGTVFGGGGRAITNGAGGKLCHKGDHLHQEGHGTRASQRYSGEQVSARYHDMHYFIPDGGYPAGAPPSEPSGGTAPSDPGEGTPPSDSCGGIDYQGQCDAGLLTWCEAGAVQTYDCPMAAMGCGWESSSIGHNCVYGCGDLDYAGACQGASLRWCENNEVNVYNCASVGLSCGYQNDAIGFNCL
jgi:hypothetical protein